MKKSELISLHRGEIREEMIAHYRRALECHGLVQFEIYIWDDGKLEFMAQPYGGGSFLTPRGAEARELYHVYTVKEPFYNPFDVLDKKEPENEEDWQKMEAEINDYVVGEYEKTVDDVIDLIIAEAEREELFASE